jgi:DNA polymerase III gamma/tau subunit
LLKTLEEPPEHVIFCLATTEPHKILPTIVSRCQRFDFRRIPRSAMVARLRFIAEQEGIQIEDEALAFVARSATGSARDAISLLDQLTAYGDERITLDRLRAVLGLSDVELVYQLAGCLVSHEVGRGLDVINQAVMQGADVRQFAQQVVEYLRAALVVRVGGNAATAEMDARTRTEIDGLVEQCSAHDLLHAIQLFNQAQLDLRGHDQGQLALELAFVEAALGAAPVEPASSSATEAAVPRVAPAPPASSVPVSPGRSAETEESPSTGTKSGFTDSASVAVRSGGPAPAPPKSLPRAPSRASDSAPPAAKASELEPQSETVSPDYIARMRGDISTALRSEGHEGRKADGLFGTVFHIGEIKVLGGSEILFALPRGVFAQASDEINQVVERVLCAVLGKDLRVRFVDQARLAEYKPSQPAPSIAPASGEEAQSPRHEAPRTGAGQTDPIEVAKSDPVVQDLVRRGGQVTDIELVE